MTLPEALANDKAACAGGQADAQAALEARRINSSAFLRAGESPA